MRRLDGDEKGGGCSRAAERRSWKAASESAGFRGSCGTGPAGVSASKEPAERARIWSMGIEMINLTA